MGNMTLFIAGIVILSLGTYLMRLGGAKLHERAHHLIDLGDVVGGQLRSVNEHSAGVTHAQTVDLESTGHVRKLAPGEYQADLLAS